MRRHRRNSNPLIIQVHHDLYPFLRPAVTDRRFFMVLIIKKATRRTIKLCQRNNLTKRPRVKSVGIECRRSSIMKRGKIGQMFALRNCRRRHEFDTHWLLSFYFHSSRLFSPLWSSSTPSIQTSKRKQTYLENTSKGFTCFLFFSLL